MRLAEESQHLTAFITPFGVFKWRVLPMGVKVGPQVFQRMVAHVLRQCSDSGPYIDDVLSSTGLPPPPPESGKGEMEDSFAYQDSSGSGRVTTLPLEPAARKACLDHHFEVVWQCFEAFERAGLTVKPSKCHMFMQQVRYVGHVLCGGQRFPDPSKTEAIAKWRAEDIKTPKALKGFLGILNWYSIYIKNFAKYAAPLMDSLKGKYQYEPPDPQTKGQLDGNGKPIKKKKIRLSPKQMEIKWTPEMLAGFDALKAAVTQELALYLPGDGRWRIYTDASDYAIGGELQQEQADGSWRPVAYFSRKLQGSREKGKVLGQMGWTVREKETYALVCCLLKFQSWIGFSEVEVLTDHSSIIQWYKEDLCTLSGPLGRRGRWHEFLSRFNLVIRYCPGEINTTADAMSRWAYPAGVAQDSNFHGSDQDLQGWTGKELEECAERQRVLREKYPDAFGSVSAITCDPVCPLIQMPAQDCALQLLQQAYQGTVGEEMSQDASYMLPDGELTENFEEFYFSTLSCYGIQPDFLPPTLSDPDTVSQSIPLDPTFLALSSRSQRRAVHRIQAKRVKAGAKKCSVRSAFRQLSWHVPGVECLGLNGMQTVKLPPEIHILHEDWTAHYRTDHIYQPYMSELESTQYAPYGGDPSKYLTYYHGKIRHNGKICVPTSILSQLIRALHTYAHPGIDKTCQLFHRKFCILDESYTATKIKEHVQQVVHHCQVCQTAKPRKGAQPDTHEGYPIPDEIFQSISVDFLDLTGDPVTRHGKIFDYVLVVVCRLSGYVIAIPCSKHITAAELAEIFVERVFTHWGLPSVIFSDHDHLVNSKFFTHCCMLSGVDEHTSPIYTPKSNGRAENAVQLVLNSLRRLLEQKCSRDWLQLLPLAVWGLNDLPGPIQGYSPHRIVFGRDPVGFGDCPPTIPEDGRRDATDFFQQLLQDRRLVQQKLTAIHKRETEKFLRNHPRQVFSPGDRVWIRVNRQGMDKQSTKLDRVWKGPAEILARVGVGRYRVATEKGEKVLHTRDLKPCLDPLSLPGKPPLHYYTDVEGVIEDNATYEVEKILKHRKRKLKGGKEILEWRVKYKGHAQPEWQPASAFMHDITDQWVQYNKDRNIKITLQDVRPDIYELRLVVDAACPK